MQTLDSFEFRQPVGAAGKTYDWDVLLDGKIRRLEQGADFRCKPQTLVMLARKAARKRGLAVRSNKVPGGVVIQAQTAVQEPAAAENPGGEAAKEPALHGAPEGTPPDQPAKARRGRK